MVLFALPHALMIFLAIYALMVYSFCTSCVDVSFKNLLSTSRLDVLKSLSTACFDGFISSLPHAFIVLFPYLPHVLMFFIRVLPNALMVLCALYLTI